MFGCRPDIDDIRKFGALAYVLVPKTPDRRREDDHATIGFVLCFAGDVIGCKVFFPATKTKQWVSDVRIIWLDGC
ncbi:TPA: hypothetical protein N0F65_006193 [Lagenidium giganteum]|uniref:Uncharacterized protein n=1 Tax=Lagenidium giganteum TaxID=4803 RepID=A0AAV2Z5T0_9STRA|nr:TPA: hypothetical protein N0F65_006193 [Lagenidium giganteum]